MEDTQIKEATMDYYIEVNELIPPIGPNKYYATLRYYKNGSAMINSEIGEVYGKTKEEAYQRMATKTQGWVKKNKR